jgi:hypothetical protein
MTTINKLFFNIFKIIKIRHFLLTAQNSLRATATCNGILIKPKLQKIIIKWTNFLQTKQIDPFYIYLSFSKK